MENAITLDNISFSFPEGKHVFNQANFQFATGQKIGLTGVNGAGKSTLFQIILGLLRIDNGKINIFGKTREKETDFLEVRKRIGLVFQNPDDQLFCPTVIEEIAFGPLNLGKSREEVVKIVNEVCDKFDLNDHKENVPFKLSTGEKRLVSIASVVSMSPEILLLDEAFEGLDDNHYELLLKYLENENQSFSLHLDSFFSLFYTRPKGGQNDSIRTNNIYRVREPQPSL